MANRLQDELLSLASRIGAIEDERDRLKVLLQAERDVLWLREAEIKGLKAELAAFPLLPEHADLRTQTPSNSPLSGGEQGAGEERGQPGTGKGTEMKIAIAIDDWKLPIFERHLAQAGYAYTKGPGVTADTRLLTVRTENAEALETVVRAANTEAARTGSAAEVQTLGRYPD